MKKFLALFLVLVLVLSMAACAGNNDTADTSTDDSSTTTEGDKTITNWRPVSSHWLCRQLRQDHAVRH